jgi:adenylate cyclase
MSSASLDAALEGTRRERFWLELFANSAIFPIANVLFELFLEGGAGYFARHHFYAMVLSALAQAAYLSREGPVHRLAGNLIGPAIYTVVEALAEGFAFFQQPHHYTYWGFALLVGALQESGDRARGARLRAVLLILESIAKSSILLTLYAVFETETAPAGAHQGFFEDPSHAYIAWAMAFLGLVAGLAAVTSQRYLAMLRGVSRQLRVYSEWFLGPALLQQAVTDPEALALARRERAILFMDMRGFTAWSETQPPETVVAGLDAYYAAAEQVLSEHPPIRSKFAADEIMAVYASASEALAAARQLVAKASLAMPGLGAGVGLHWGPVVEGLIGGARIKQFDVIGDTVNTAKRIEGAAEPGEVLASDAFVAAARAPAGDAFDITVKGKAAPVRIHRLAALDAGQG